MALPSQTARTGSARSKMSSRGRGLAGMMRAVPGLRDLKRPGAAIGGAALLAVAAGGAWLALGRGGDEGKESESPTPLAATMETANNAVKPREAEKPPVVTMGESSGIKPTKAPDVNPQVRSTAAERPGAAPDQAKRQATSDAKLQAATDDKTQLAPAAKLPDTTGNGTTKPTIAGERTGESGRDVASVNGARSAATGTNSGSINVNRSGSRLQAGLDLVAQNKPVEARAALSAALQAPDVSEADADRMRMELSKISDRLVFGSEVVPGDPYAGSYTIQSGDALARIPKSQKLAVDWRFLKRINKISAPERIQVGQRIKTVKGPFHAVVSKSDYRMDIYLGHGPEKVFVRSFTVGLGEYDSTPEGVFIVKPNSKLVNPQWTNPRTGERFSADDPKNPIGERWIGLEGITESLRDVMGIGIHGTIDPDSIGQQRSMGCIRMKSDDVEVVYEILMEGISTVEVR